jgi:hypothetical protein
MSDIPKLLPCPFCGKPAGTDLRDTLYPSGYWRETDGVRHYLSPADAGPCDGHTWRMHCKVDAGGCGCSISGDSRDEAIAAWNRRPAQPEREWDRHLFELWWGEYLPEHNQSFAWIAFNAAINSFDNDPPPTPPGGCQYPECSGDPTSCPENEGYGCCREPAQPAHPPMGDGEMLELEDALKAAQSATPTAGRTET